MPPPGFIIGMLLAAVAVVLIILRTRSHRELNQSALRLRRSQERLGNSLDELDAVIKVAQAKLAERDAASTSAKEPAPAASGSRRQGGARCFRCGGPIATLHRPHRVGVYTPLVRVYMRGRLGAIGYGYGGRRKTASRRLKAHNRKRRPAAGILR